jgi:phosphocarrier protein HPr
MSEARATHSALLTNAIGLHARPSVKLTKLAKTFASQIEVGLTESGPWVDAKSIVKVMAIKAAKGATLHFRAQGPDAQEAIVALRELVALDFQDNEAIRAEGQSEDASG